MQIGGDPPIHLGRTPDNECDGQQLVCDQCEPFRSVQMIARENTTFEAVIGPAANPRGYTGITGLMIKRGKNEKLAGIKFNFWAPYRCIINYKILLADPNFALVCGSV